MKKSILKIAALALVAVFTLGVFVACDKGQGDGDDGIFAIECGETIVKLGGKAEGVLEALGKPISSQPTGNCGGLGESTRYEYPAFVLGVVDYEDGDVIIDTIELKNDGAETSKGIYIGSSEADVRAKYGEPDSENGRSLVYENEDMLLEFGINDGAVSSIVLRCK